MEGERIYENKLYKKISAVALMVCLSLASVIPCYAATSSISINVTTTNVSSQFQYDEAGHQLKVEIYYQEKNNITGEGRSDTVFHVVNGNVTTVSVSRGNSIGYVYTWAKATGYVDNVSVGSASKGV